MIEHCRQLWSSQLHSRTQSYRLLVSHSCLGVSHKLFGMLAPFVDLACPVVEASLDENVEGRKGECRGLHSSEESSGQLSALVRCTPRFDWCSP